MHCTSQSDSIHNYIIICSLNSRGPIETMCLYQVSIVFVYTALYNSWILQYKYSSILVRIDSASPNELSRATTAAACSGCRSRGYLPGISSSSSSSSSSSRVPRITTTAACYAIASGSQQALISLRINLFLAIECALDAKDFLSLDGQLRALRHLFL